jgi:hypothetical protein
MLVNKKLLYPLFYFIFIWISYIIIRNSFIIVWEQISLITVFFLLTTFITIVLFYLLWLYLFIKMNINKNIKTINLLLIDRKKIKFIYNYLLYVSIFYILLVSIRFFTELTYYDITFSLSSFVKLREITMEGSAFSQSMLGIFSTMFSGFHVILLIFVMWSNKQLTQREIKIAKFIFSIATFTLLLGGGRNGIFISILIVLLSIYFINFANLRKIKINKIRFFVVMLFILIIFIYIFVARDQYNGITLIDRIRLNEYNYNVKFNDSMISLLYADNFILKYGSYFVMYMTFYLTHSLTFLDLGFTTDLPKNAYYFGAMEFYPIVLLLNNFGFDFITIDAIRQEWSFAGNYTTLFLPLYYDFGIIGTFLLIVFLVFLFVFNLLKFAQNKNLISLLLLIIVSLIFILSPIYSFFSLGIFLPILFTIMNVFIIVKFFNFKNKKSKLQEYKNEK